MQVHVVLGTIVNQDVSSVVAHSSIVCKKCFKLIDDIDSLEGQLINMKQVRICSGDVIKIIQDKCLGNSNLFCLAYFSDTCMFSIYIHVL